MWPSGLEVSSYSWSGSKQQLGAKAKTKSCIWSNFGEGQCISLGVHGVSSSAGR